jgi:microsomal dipeptidase-like Zn-dependent dipeptidase
MEWGAALPEFARWEDWPNLTCALLEHGYSDEEVRGVVGANWLSYMRRAIGT